MEKVVDRHLWYDGDISISDEYRSGAEDVVECSFSDLSEQSKEAVKNLIAQEAKEFTNTNSIVAFFDLTLDDGREIPNATIEFSCSGLEVVDKLENNSAWQNDRCEYFTNLPDAVREAVINDILDAKDGKTKFSQLNFSEYLSDAELKDLLTKEAQEKENTVEKAQEKPEKKKHKYRGR